MKVEKTEILKPEDKLIDIDGIFMSRNPGLYRFIPRFAINWLKHILHEDALNFSIYKNRAKNGLGFAEALIKEFNVNVQVQGSDNIKANERLLIAANHPLGGIDGIALIHAIGKLRPDVVFPVNDFLMNIKNLDTIFIPINKHGSNASNIRILNETFESEKTLLYFPAGLVSRKQKGVIKDLVWKKTFLSKAKRNKRNIVPVHIDGRNTDFFYNLANWRKRLGLKTNIEMLFLVDEVYKQNNKNINIKIGKAVDINFFDRRLKDAEWAMKLQEFVYKLAEGETRSFEEWFVEQEKIKD
jgi:putative hemolysin